MEKVDPSLVDNELIFPTEETLVGHPRLHGARRGKKDREYQGDFADVIGG